MDGDTERLPLPNQYEQPLAPRDPRVDQVALEQHVGKRPVTTSVYPVKRPRSSSQDSCAGGDGGQFSGEESRRAQAAALAFYIALC
jgi:hypothetical protein